MDIAERNGADLRRPLASAARFSDAAIARAERWVKIPGSMLSALLVRPTVADQRVRLVVRRGAWLATLFMGPRGVCMQLEPLRPAAVPRTWPRCRSLPTAGAGAHGWSRRGLRRNLTAWGA